MAHPAEGSLQENRIVGMALICRMHNRPGRPSMF